jgi:hypothetical protein
MKWRGGENGENDNGNGEMANGGNGVMRISESYQHRGSVAIAWRADNGGMAENMA